MHTSILFTQRGSDQMTRGHSNTTDRIVTRFTETLSPARNSTTYFMRNEEQDASARYFVNNITTEIFQSVSEGNAA